MLTVGPRVGTILNLVDMAFTLLTSKARRLRFPDYRFGIKKRQVAWLALHAFRAVLARKQTGFGEVITWLDREMRKLRVKKDARPAGFG
jgi:telomerase reverse transcriptase